MKSTCFSLLATAAMFVSCAPRHTITAHIEGLGDTVYVTWYDTSKPMESDADATWDTIPAVAGRFVYDIPAEGPAHVSIIGAAQTADRSWRSASTIDLIVTPGGRVRLTGRQFDNHIDYSVRGSADNDLWASHANVLRPLSIARDSINAAIDAAFDRGEDASALFAARNAVNGELRGLRREFIRSHPDSWVSSAYIFDIELDSAKVYIDLLSPAVLNGPLKSPLDKLLAYYDEYQAYLESQKVIKEGVSAPAFTLPDREGKSVSLADIAAEYVVLDFWGSWCGPCITGFPKMKEYYAKYRSRVEFVGIACNDRHEDWVAALDKYALGWTQLIDSPDVNMPVKYAVGAFPTKMLLGPGPDRKIMRIFVGEGEDFYHALDELLK